jgi:hypothetical protein
MMAMGRAMVEDENQAWRCRVGSDLVLMQAAPPRRASPSQLYRTYVKLEPSVFRGTVRLG